VQSPEFKIPYHQKEERKWQADGIFKGHNKKIRILYPAGYRKSSF
jgi:hypothetical protein